MQENISGISEQTRRLKFVCQMETKKTLCKLFAFYVQYEVVKKA